MTAESSSAITTSKPDNAATTPPTLPPPLPKQAENPHASHTHWVTHILLWLLGTSVAALSWKVIQLDQRIASLEQRQAIPSASQLTLPTPPQRVIPPALPNNSTPPPAPAPSPSVAAVTPPPAHPSAPTAPNLLSNIASLQVNPVMPDWARRTSLNIAHALYREGNWETATTALEILRNSSATPHAEVEPLWRTFQSQRAALETMKQQLHHLESRIESLPLRKDQPVQILTESNERTSSPKLTQLWNEVREDMSLLVHVEPSSAAGIRTRNEAAFEWRYQLTQALRAYHRAWRQGNKAEQERLHQYSDALLSYAFDMNAPSAKSFQDALKTWMQQPALLRPSFPASFGEPL